MHNQGDNSKKKLENFQTGKDLSKRTEHMILKHGEVKIATPY